jgi:sulfotransferase family protein
MGGLVDAIHIGFPKTGTTWLQHAVIPRLSRVASLGKPASVDVRYYYWFQDLLACDSFAFDPIVFRDRFAALNEVNRGALAARDVKLASFELLSGELYTGQDSKALLDRLHAIFGDVKIVITIREQAAMVESIYRHYVASGGSLHVREFVYKIMSPCVDVWGNRYLLQRFQYDRTTEYCRGRFGAENVCVVPFELLRRDPNAFVARLCGFLGVSTPSAAALGVQAQNASLSALGISVLRIFNQLVSTPLSDSPLMRSVPAIYSRFSHRVFRPLDRVLLSGLSRRRRFVDKPAKWPLRLLLKRVIGPLVRVRLTPTSGNEMELERLCPSGLMLDLVRFLDWPEKNQALRSGSTRYVADIDRRSIADSVRTAYADSNRRTQEMTGLPLDELGYAVASK